MFVSSISSSHQGVYFHFFLHAPKCDNIEYCCLLSNGCKEILGQNLKYHLENTGICKRWSLFRCQSVFQRLIFSFMHIQKSVLTLFEPALACTATVSVFLNVLVQLTFFISASLLWNSLFQCLPRWSPLCFVYFSGF